MSQSAVILAEILGAGVFAVVVAIVYARQRRTEADQQAEVGRLNAVWGRLEVAERRLDDMRRELVDCHVQRDHLRSRVLKLELQLGLPGDGD